MKLNGDPKELKTQQKDVGTVNGERAHSGGRRKVKVKMPGVG